MKRTAGICLINKENNYLVVKQRGPGLWGFPKGSIRPDETTLNGALRELREETGIILDDITQYVRIISRPAIFLFFVSSIDTFINDEKEISDIAWKSLDELKSLKKNRTLRKFLNKFKKKDIDNLQMFLQKYVDKERTICVSNMTVRQFKLLQSINIKIKMV